MLAEAPESARAGSELCNQNTCYYYPNNTDSQTQHDGAMIRQWARTDPTIATDPISFGAPTITSIEVAPHAKYPATGAGQYHLGEDAYYVVINGSAIIGGLGDGRPFSSGDWLWAMAGIAHGPIVNTGATPLMVREPTIIGVG